MKKSVYFHEFNILMAGKVYLPNVSGMLQANCQKYPEITANYQFMPFLFIRQKPEQIIDKWHNPAVLAFSSSMWNHQLNLVLSREGRKIFPEALIIFGGPHIPTQTASWLTAHPWVDVVVRGEGEETFAELLIKFLSSRDFSSIPGIICRQPNTNYCYKTSDRPFVDVNDLPSPYLLGCYDELIEQSSEIEYQVILETNRGCPFRCAFCYWGNGFSKIRTFGLDRLEREIAWIAEKKISYVFGADANFGMLPRDLTIAEFFVKQKQQSGYPHSFRVCYGKNVGDRIARVAELLESNSLTTGVTVSFQSTNPETLENIGRNNISLDTYRQLLCQYREKNIRVYTELLLGLPGETYRSFAEGIEEVFQAGLYDQVGIFFCQVLPNTDMADPDYSRQYGIKTKRLALVEFHALPRPVGEITEYEEIVVATKTMPHEDWKQSARLAWMAQTIHGLKLGFFVTLYLCKRFGIKYTELFEYLLLHGQAEEKFPVFAGEIAYYEDYLSRLLSGQPQCVFLPEFGKISWQIEEATFLRLNERLDVFYDEMVVLLSELLLSRNIKFISDEVVELVRYQSARISRITSLPIRYYQFNFNLPEYFDLLLSDQLADVRICQQNLRVEATNFFSNREKFAQQVIWFGRRHCRVLEKASWY